MNTRRRRMTMRKCSVECCQTDIPGYMLMCFEHWKLVPSRMRVAIQAELQEGKAQRAHPTQRYLDAAREAIDTVNTKIAEQAARRSSSTAQPNLRLA